MGAVVGWKSCCSRQQVTTGSSKMKVLAVLLLCGMAAAGGFGRDQKKMYKAWANMKALESCWGEENMKTYQIEAKLAISQCLQQDVPEINLPPFRPPYRFINTLMVSANKKEQNKMEYVMKMLQEMEKYNSNDYMSHLSSNNNKHNPFNFGSNSNSNSWTEKFMKKIALRNAMNKLAEQMMSHNQQNVMDFGNMFSGVDQFNYDNMESNSELNVEKMMDMLFEDKMKENMMKYKMQQTQGASTYNFRENNPFNNKNSYRQRMSALLQRHKRQADGSVVGSEVVATLPESLDLGDRLADKLKQQQDEMKSQVGNMTCIMKKLGVLNQQNELDINTQLNTMRKYNFESQWLKKRTEEDIEMCVKVAEAIPKEVQQKYNFPEMVNLCKLETYIECYQEAEMKTCMFYDLKKKLETSYGPVETILEQANLTENQLFPLIMDLFYGDEMEYFMA